MKQEILEIIDELNGDLTRELNLLTQEIKHRTGNSKTGEFTLFDIAEYVERTLNSVTYSLTQITNLLNK